jgi:hypothetical protein
MALNIFLLCLWEKRNLYDPQWWPCGGLSEQLQIRTEHMKTNQPNPLSRPAWKVATGLLLLAMGSCPSQNAPRAETAQTNQPIPWSEIGAKVTAQYSGDGLAVTATPDGARLKCSFQKLEGQITPEEMMMPVGQI